MKPDFCQWCSMKEQKAQTEMQEMPSKHQK